MAPPSARLRPRLPRPRLLPITIAAMSALFAIKSVTLVQAAAQEAGTPSQSMGKGDPAAGFGAGGGGPVAVTPKPAEPAMSKADPVGSPVSDAERAVLLDLRRRRDVLDDRARELDRRDADIAAASRRLDQRVQELAALQSRLETLEVNRRQHTVENWAGLVKVYETMKPREAAAIFDVLDMQVLLQVLDRMQERRAAPVLAAMQPDRARLATQLLAELRTRAVTPAPAPTDTKG